MAAAFSPNSRWPSWTTPAISSKINQQLRLLRLPDHPTPIRSQASGFTPLQGTRPPLPVEGQRRPAPSYTLPPSRARALSMKNEVLSVHPADPLQENGSKKGHESATEGDVLSSAPPCPGQDMKGHPTESGQDVFSRIPVTESDLGDERTKDTPTSTYKGDGPQPEAAQQAPVDCVQVTCWFWMRTKLGIAWYLQ